MSGDDDAMARYVAGMRELWGLADYGALAERLAPAAVALVGATAPAAGSRVLDLPAGTGTAALLVAGRGAKVTACDVSPRMVELGLEATTAAGLAIAWREADAEALPLADGSFDVVLSSFGLIFVPRPAVALGELRRDLAAGGQVGFTAWTPDGFMGAMTELMGHWLPAQSGIADVLDWGRPAVVREWLTAAGLTPIRTQRRTISWRFDSPPAMTEFLLAPLPGPAGQCTGTRRAGRRDVRGGRAAGQSRRRPGADRRRVSPGRRPNRLTSTRMHALMGRGAESEPPA
jgi:ubiquinone/menaquinone biosynthesis C-methylase UbiE